jgi:hypothetical protein
MYFKFHKTNPKTLLFWQKQFQKNSNKILSKGPSPKIIFTFWQNFAQKKSMVKIIIIIVSTPVHK